MEFIRHSGDLQCSRCGEVSSNRNIYYCVVEDSNAPEFKYRLGSRFAPSPEERIAAIEHRKRSHKQVYWFVCGSCEEWTRLAFGYDEIGTLSSELRQKNDKIRKEFAKSFQKYGANW